MTMKYVRKLILVPVEEWEKKKKTTNKNNSSRKCRSGTVTSDEEYESHELWEKCYNNKEYETDNETEIDSENEGEIEGEEEY